MSSQHNRHCCKKMSSFDKLELKAALIKRFLQRSQLHFSAVVAEVLNLVVF